MFNSIKKNRKSVFREVGLATEDTGAISPRIVLQDPFEPEKEKRSHATAGLGLLNTKAGERGVTTPSTHGLGKTDDEDERSPDSAGPPQPTGVPLAQSESSSPQSPTTKTPWYVKLTPTGRRTRVRVGSSAPPSPFLGVTTMTMLALAVAIIAPTLLGKGGQDAGGVVDAGPILKRADATSMCARWAQQTALLNGTLYIYGGEAKSTIEQVNNTWNNDFLTLDLTSSWDTTSPSLTTLPQPSGPPAVALGYLWNDYNNLYLYGGEFADNPVTTPAAVATWQYAIDSSTWTSFGDLETSAGNFSDGGGVAVQRAAEGAGVSVPELGLSWYFGGHLDYLTTPGWSDQVARVYLKTLLEFTHPGYANDAVTSLRDSGAPTGGAYRNITQGGVQGTEAFTERADGVLVFVPGWGVSGVLIGLAGGTASDFTNDMSQLDVYDIASSTWYHQTTTGTAPGVRVNPCAVVASAPDASSFQIYLFGGQNLQPAGDQIQYDDMYILTIPSFTWIGPIQQTGSTIPFARAGHTCNLRDGQMILLGGFNTTVTDCDSPGVYIFNASSLSWSSSFSALSHPADLDSGNSVLAASYGYTVPDEVVSVIGGSPEGSATVTTPAASATGGPFATGRSPVFTITASSSGPTSTVTSASSSAAAASSKRAEGGLIAAIVVACLAGVTAGYLGYCAWLYRRQVRAYKTHLAVTNRFPARSQSHGSFGRMLTFGRKGSRRAPGTAAADGGGGEAFAWVGRNRPSASSHDNSKLMTPTSASGTTSRPSPYSDEKNSGSAGRPSTSGSTEGLLDGQELSYFSVVLGPRRALRVVNGLEEGEGQAPAQGQGQGQGRTP
ncbi:hypothetical protein N0V93_009828 [Gnomoniopsis smithogilvyi]|uniref:Kelch repeat protein n=1 Tax=Gnomoniopsis smithogilvyi TaxID=1191159 RepID=A0A9W8YL71_9PEZI|nr:hypothetical protein N0V93_009828 [Gnomoniopsis smithogilvyi]